MVRYFLSISLFVFLAQGSWAFVVSDTLIIDGEIIYIEKQEEIISDSLHEARKVDYKEKKKAVIWGAEVFCGSQFTQFSISNGLQPQLLSVKDFLKNNSNASYQFSEGLGAFFQIHNRIELGLGINFAKGEVVEESAAPQQIEEIDSYSFIANGGQIFQIFQTEVQPQVFELDTLPLPIFQEKLNFSTVQIPLKFRFYVNDFDMKKRWRAYGEIAPTYRSYKLTRQNTAVLDMLFLNNSGITQIIPFENQNYSSVGVLVGAGGEFKISKRMRACVQGNWSFPPTYFLSTSGLKYHSQYSNVLVGLRFLIGHEK